MTRDYYLPVTMSRRTFPTKFVWDHGGREVSLCIVKPEGSETVPLARSEDGTFEITTSLGQVRQFMFTMTITENQFIHHL